MWLNYCVGLSMGLGFDGHYIISVTNCIVCSVSLRLSAELCTLAHNFLQERPLDLIQRSTWQALPPLHTYSFKHSCGEAWDQVCHRSSPTGQYYHPYHTYSITQLSAKTHILDLNPLPVQNCDLQVAPLKPACLTTLYQYELLKSYVGYIWYQYHLSIS